MEHLVRQITDRFQNEIVSGGYETTMMIDDVQPIGEHFWLNDTSNDSHSGMYEVLGVVNGLAG